MQCSALYQRDNFPPPPFWMCQGTLSLTWKKTIFYTTKILAKIHLPEEKSSNLPKNASFTKETPMSCQNSKEITTNTLKSTKLQDDFSKTANHLSCILPEIPTNLTQLLVLRSYLFPGLPWVTRETVGESYYSVVCSTNISRNVLKYFIFLTIVQSSNVCQELFFQDGWLTYSNGLEHKKGKK